MEQHTPTANPSGAPSGGHSGGRPLALGRLLRQARAAIDRYRQRRAQRPRVRSLPVCHESLHMALKPGERRIVLGLRVLIISPPPGPRE